jgi:hypothetical protein
VRQSKNWGRDPGDRQSLLGKAVPNSVSHPTCAEIPASVSLVEKEKEIFLVPSPLPAFVPLWNSKIYTSPHVEHGFGTQTYGLEIQTNIAVVVKRETECGIVCDQEGFPLNN